MKFGNITIGKQLLVGWGLPNALGSVTGVNVINGGIGFTEDPDLYIKSDTGYNAKLIPVFKVTRVDPDILDTAPSTGVVQVIDCVGKF